MNPIFTLNYPELVVAQYLQNHFLKKQDFSVLIPLSGQQKGYDLALMRRHPSGSKVVTFQVKSSKTYSGTPGVAPRSGLQTFKHYMWLGRFLVQSEADFFILLGLYAPNPSSLKSTASVWKPHMLLFTHSEMSHFMTGVRQRKLNKPDTHFGFGFDNAKQAYQTRGHALPHHPDYSHHLLGARHALIAAAL